MGSPTNEVGRFDDEVEHSVTLTRNYWLKATEVTQDDWLDVMDTSPSSFSSCGTCPVESVSWYDALDYVNQLSDRNGLPRCYSGESFVGLDCLGYRLPTEAEWEFAARAGTTTATYNGNISSLDCSEEPVLEPIAWYCGNSGATHPVGTKAPNAWGLYDMLGNVFEWVHDGYASYEGAVTGPIGPGSGGFRVIRGGGWFSFAQYARSAFRFSFSPDYRDFSFGFRPARSIP